MTRVLGWRRVGSDIPVLRRVVSEKMKDPKECFKAHPMVHTLTGVGVGFLLAGLIGGLAGSTAVLLGIIIILAGIATDAFLVK